ncbi:MAG: SUMF1/EgtB/PvdO family nonheme iron enzyme [Prevotella sp.]|nr:SUMF1/EgtB/PvdO family nonheme iron enzyme [Prevotella sp.]
MNTNAMLPVGTLLQGGKYRVERQLASGGFGNTYVVVNIKFDDRLALKEFFMADINERGDDGTTVITYNPKVNADTFTQQLRKFEKEAQRLYKLRNEHIVRVHDLFDENGTSYYVMDFIDGESLSERIKRTGQPLGEQEVRSILNQVLNALETVHAQGIYHLDIKPANIMQQADGTVKLIDFGASKQLEADSRLTTAPVAYTNHYAPIEQRNQDLQRIGPWTDLYALGATLYNLLKMQRPPMVDVLDEDELNAAFTFPSGVSEQMQQIVRWMMTPQRKRRPQSVAEVRQFLCSVVEDDDEATIIAKPQKPSVSASSGKRHSWLIPLVVVGAALIGYLIFGLLPRHNDGEAIMTVVIGDADTSAIPDSTITVNGVTFVMKGVQGGTFQMGSDDSEADGDEKPVHQVTVSSFRIGQTEVTQELWQAVMGTNPSSFKGAKRPVEQVGWNDCQDFIRELNRLTGRHFRLPTEAEWEYAARGGNRSSGSKYAGSSSIDAVAWYRDNSGNQTHEVGTKQPNELGLYDMTGNVSEWCSDWFCEYSSSSQTNPTGPSSGSNRVSRGGSCYFNAQICRVSVRGYWAPDHRGGGNLGLRLAL